MSQDRELQFVDTNILAYAHDLAAGEKRERPSALISSLREREHGGLSVQGLGEFCVTVTEKVAKPVDVELTSGVIRELSQWRVHSPESAVVFVAIDLPHREQFSF